MEDCPILARHSFLARSIFVRVQIHQSWLVTGVGKINATPPKNTLHKRLHKTTHKTSNNSENRVFKGINASKDVKKVVMYYPVVALCFQNFQLVWFSYIALFITKTFHYTVWEIKEPKKKTKIMWTLHASSTAPLSLAHAQTLLYRAENLVKPQDNWLVQGGICDWGRSFGTIRIDRTISILASGCHLISW